MSEREIINTYDQLIRFGGDRIAIFYHGGGSGRFSMPQKWAVARYINGQQYVTNKDAHWTDYHCKTFGLFNGGQTHSERKAKALKEALDWVAKTYNRTDLIRNRLGDYVEREVNEKFPIPPRPRVKKEAK